jgi:hypothetical protein
MITQKLKKNKGFALLFAVMLSSIVLAITLGVANIALKEINFSTSAKDTNDAFLAADVGVECALFLDKSPSYFGLPVSQYIQVPACAGIYLDGYSLYTSGGYWDFWISHNLGSAGNSCAHVVVTKMNVAPFTATVTSIGYSNGSVVSGSGVPDTCSPAQNAVERELDVNYSSSS